MVLESLVNPGILEQLFAFIFFLKIVYVLSIGAVGFIIVKKVMRSISPKIAGEVGVLATVLLIAFAWIFIFASLAITAGVIVLFYLAAPFITGGITLLAVLLKD